MNESYDFSVVERVIQDGLRYSAYTACCVLVGQDERILYRRAFGHLSIEEDSAPVNERTLFDVGSITKPLVVGMLCLRAVEEGRIRLGDRLDTFLDVPEDKAGITFRQILTHTAGLGPVHLWQTSQGIPTGSEMILTAPLLYTPGTDLLYTCSGYVLLGQLLECIYNAPLDQLAARMIFDPLHMNSTGYRPRSENIAATEMQDNGCCLQGIVHDENARALRGVAGNAGIFSNMDDLALWMQMFCSGGQLPDGSRYLCPASLRLAMKPTVSFGNETRSLIFKTAGPTGGFMGDLFPENSVGHTGFPGTSVVLSPDDHLYVILLTNRICPSRDSSEIHRIRCLVHNAVYQAVL